MKARAFDYARPTTLDEALALHAAAEGDCCYISGGQSLVPALALRLQAPSTLIDLAHIDALHGVTLEGDSLRIGAMTRHVDAIEHPLIAAHAPLLSAAAHHVAHPAIRNRGTIGGSLAHADPASEFPAMMLALGATLEIHGPDGARSVAADDYFLDLFQTALEPGDILTALTVPVIKPAQRWAFDEIARRRGDYALVGCGLIADMDQQTVSAIRIAFFSVAATPVRARTAEAALVGRPLDAAAIAEAQAALAPDLDILDSDAMPASARHHLARVLLGRLLGQIGAAP